LTVEILEANGLAANPKRFQMLILGVPIASLPVSLYAENILITSVETVELLGIDSKLTSSSHIILCRKVFIARHNDTLLRVFSRKCTYTYILLKNSILPPNIAFVTPGFNYLGSLDFVYLFMQYSIYIKIFKHFVTIFHKHDGRKV